MGYYLFKLNELRLRVSKNFYSLGVCSVIFTLLSLISWLSYTIYIFSVLGIIFSLFGIKHSARRLSVETLVINIIMLIIGSGMELFSNPLLKYSGWIQLFTIVCTLYILINALIRYHRALGSKDDITRKAYLSVSIFSLLTLLVQIFLEIPMLGLMQPWNMK